jgi:nicotinate phosphoribosyltransferase
MSDQTPEALFPHREHLGLLTDLYELTMAAGYFLLGQAQQRAVFELWVRRLPQPRNFLVFAGLEQIVHYLTHLHFSPEEIHYLRRHPALSGLPEAWFEHLSRLRFEGDLWAVAEGTVVFAGEPLLRVAAPLDVAQIVETYLITSVSVQTMVASKAARTVLAAEGRPLIDFGARRAHGPQAGLLAARAAYLAGYVGTSYVEAGRRLGIPTFGTQAHSWIMAHDSERMAFANFGKLFGQHATYLVDTYDTLNGVQELLAAGVPVQAVRLDSGDLVQLSRQVRKLLDDAGRADVRIVASGDLNEYKIRDLVAAQAPIDLFGVGTELVTSRDDPTLAVVYKLVERGEGESRQGCWKQSPGKPSYPWAKQVWRQRDAAGVWQRDVVARAEEDLPGEPLLEQVLERGRLVRPLPGLEAARQHCRHQLAQLPAYLRTLEPLAQGYPVAVSPRLQAEARSSTP